MGSIPRVRRDTPPAPTSASDLTKERSERMAAVRSDQPAVRRPKLSEAKINALYAGARYRDVRVRPLPQWRPPLTADRPWRSSLASLLR